MASITNVARVVGLSKQALSEHIKRWDVDYQSMTDAELTLMYCSHLRDMAANASYVDDEIDGRKEKALLDRRKREMTELELAKLRGELVESADFLKKYGQLVANAKAEFLSSAEKIKAVMFTVYGVDIDVTYINEINDGALQNLSQFEPVEQSSDSRAVEDLDSSGEADNHAVGEKAPGNKRKSKRNSGKV